jgi:tetratricopeptide (TPR) repeat protein
MLYARHHRPERLNADRATAYLQSAFDILATLPNTMSVRYERVFNRNGYALILYRNKRYPEAAALLEEGLAVLAGSQWEKQLHSTVLLNNLGRVYADMGQPDRAEATLSRAIAIDPLFAEYHQDLGSFLCDQGRYDEARAACNRALQLDPAIPEAAQLLGYACAQAGDLEAAAESYEYAWHTGSATAGLALLRALSELEAYDRVCQVAASIVSSAGDTESQAEVALIELEARSMLDPDVDVRSGLAVLAQRYPESQLVAENIKLAGVAL